MSCGTLRVMDSEPSLPPVATSPPIVPAPAGAAAQVGAARIAKWRLAVAFAIAGVSDAISVVTSFAPPIEWAVDLVTASLLFVVLGWQWLLLPGLIMEAIPGVGALPFWVLVVAGVAVWGTVRPMPK